MGFGVWGLGVWVLCWYHSVCARRDACAAHGKRPRASEFLSGSCNSNWARPPNSISFLNKLNCTARVAARAQAQALRFARLMLQLKPQTPNPQTPTPNPRQPSRLYSHVQAATRAHVNKVCTCQMHAPSRPRALGAGLLLAKVGGSEVLQAREGRAHTAGDLSSSTHKTNGTNQLPQQPHLHQTVGAAANTPL